MQSANKQILIGFRYRLYIWIFYAIALFLTIFSYAADNKQQFERAKPFIFLKEKTLQQQQKQRTTLLDKLKKQKQYIVHSPRALQNTKRMLKTLNHNIDYLINSIRQLYSRQATQQELLIQQLDITFHQWKNSRLELVLKNQENIHIKKILAYFSCLNEVRTKIINNLYQIYVNLSVKKREKQYKQQHQQLVLQQQQQQQQSARAIYQKILSNLNSSIAKGKLQLKKLHQREEQLRNSVIHAECKVRKVQLVRKKKEQVKSYGNIYKQNVSERVLDALTGGLGHPSRQDIWPVRGRTLHRFGESQQGEICYKGLVIAAPKGSKVKAIASGRVLMADWLQGYRIIVVIEHGKGDMSLYGYNQNTLVNVGDQVKAGQPIAVIGTNSSKRTPALYFEIRRHGQAVNPIPWLEK